MPGQIAEAFVRIRPDFTAFRAELSAGLTASLAGAQGKLAASSQAAAAGIAATGTSAAQAAGLMDALDKKNKAATASMLGLAGASGKLDAALLGLRTAVGSAAVIGLSAGALGAIAFGKAIRATIQATADFEEQLNVLQATAGATDEEIKRVSEAAKQLGADVRLPAVSAADAAEAMTSLVRAGLSVEEAMDGAEGVLQLATAAQISNADAANLAANALNAFGLEGKDATRVADVLANAANAAQGSITDFGAALSQSAAVARQVGISLEDTTTILSLLAQNGLRGSDAGTSLRTALLRLVSPTERANDLIRTLGLNIRDAQGNVRPEVFAEFGEATAALGPEVRDAAAVIIFGQDAIRAVAVAAREGAQGLEVMRFKIDQQGTAAEIARARTEGLRGAQQGLSSAAESAAINVGLLTSPALTGLLQMLTDVLAITNKVAAALERLGEIDLPSGGQVGDFFEVALRTINPVVNQVAIFRDLTRALASGDIPTLGKALASALSTPARVGITAFEAFTQTQKEEAVGLLESLQELQTARVALAEQGLPVGDLTQEIQDVRAEIRALGEEAGAIIPVTDVEREIAALEGVLRRLGSIRLAPGIDTADIDQQMRDIAARIAGLADGTIKAAEQGTKQSLASLRGSLEAALDLFELDPGGPQAEAFLNSIRKLIRRIQEEGGSFAGAAGAEIGKRLMDAMGTSITAEEAQVIGAARQALRNAIQTGQEQVRNAIQSARENLNSLGDDLSQQLEEIIDVGPIGRRIEELNEELDALEERQSQRSLGFDVRQAEIELRDFKESISGLGRQTPEQKRNLKEVLAPFQQNVADAKDDLREFTLEQAIEQQEDLKEAAIKTVKDGIEKLIDSFQDGETSAGDFESKLNDIIKGPLNILKTQGKNLGLSISNDFFTTVKNLVDQVRELSGFMGRAGTEPGRQVNEVGDVAAGAAANVATARKNLAEAIAEAQQSKGDKDIVDQLKKILAALEGRGGTRKATGSGPGGTGAQTGTLRP